MQALLPPSAKLGVCLAGAWPPPSACLPPARCFRSRCRHVPASPFPAASWPAWSKFPLPSLVLPFTNSQHVVMRCAFSFRKRMSCAVVRCAGNARCCNSQVSFAMSGSGNPPAGMEREMLPLLWVERTTLRGGAISGLLTSSGLAVSGPARGVGGSSRLSFSAGRPRRWCGRSGFRCVRSGRCL